MPNSGFEDGTYNGWNEAARIGILQGPQVQTNAPGIGSAHSGTKFLHFQTSDEYAYIVLTRRIERPQFPNPPGPTHRTSFHYYIKTDGADTATVYINYKEGIDLSTSVNSRNTNGWKESENVYGPVPGSADFMLQVVISNPGRNLVSVGIDDLTFSINDYCKCCKCEDSDRRRTNISATDNQLPICNVDPPSPTPDPTPTPSPSPTTSTPSPCGTNYVQNGDFDSGSLAPWTWNPQSTDVMLSVGSSSTGPGPLSPPYNAYIYAREEGTVVLTQTLTVAAAPFRCSLGYYLIDQGNNPSFTAKVTIRVDNQICAETTTGVSEQWKTLASSSDTIVVSHNDYVLKC